jgi:hypothetical protein
MTPEYLAGLFDGEGCIDVQRMYPQEGKGRLYVRPRIRMCMADSACPLMQVLQIRFGGHLVSRKASGRNQQNSWSLEWLSGDDIRRIVDVILPHLVLKREQAHLVLWWLDNMSGRQRKQSCSPGIEDARKAFAEELFAMKRDPQRLSEDAVARIVLLVQRNSSPDDYPRG